MAKLKGSSKEMPPRLHLNTLSDIFTTINTLDTIKYSSFLRELEVIAEAIGIGRAWIVSDNYYQK